MSPARQPPQHPTKQGCQCRCICHLHGGRPIRCPNLAHVTQFCYACLSEFSCRSGSR